MVNTQVFIGEKLFKCYFKHEVYRAPVDPRPVRTGHIDRLDDRIDINGVSKFPQLRIYDRANDGLPFFLRQQ